MEVLKFTVGGPKIPVSSLSKTYNEATANTSLYRAKREQFKT